jgi:hypothetical protein
VRVVLAVLAAVASLTFAASPAGGYSPPPPVMWSSLFPGVPTLTNPQFTGVVGCETPRMACIDREIAQLDAVRVHFGCDHRAVFATTYELLTMVLRDEMRANPHLFQDPAWVIGEDVTFANLYFRAVSDYEHGRPVAPAWKVAFDTAARGDANAVQDMLLGINAHVQRDMPFMLAAVGLHTPSGASRKHDHDALNLVLNDAYQRVTDTIAQRFDPAENFIAPGANVLLGTTGNVAGDQLVELWRELVWRNAENLLNAHDGAALQNTKDGIETNAVTWARGIALIQLPGYRTSRDAYCAAHNLGPLVLAKD